MELEQFKSAYAELAKDKGARDTLAELIVEYIDPEGSGPC